MASLLKRTVILSFSRFANQAIVLLSPMLLVRILSVGEYGQYREFLLYAALLVPLVTFGVNQSLIYFVPKHPERERVWLTQTTLYTLAASSVAITGIYLAGDLIRSNTSFDFVTSLQLYILFYANLGFLECYWLGKKRTDFVLYFSASRLATRMIVVVVVAFLTRNAQAIVTSLVVMEAVRCLLTLGYGMYRRWFSFGISRETLSTQMLYFLPLGAGGIVEIMNTRAGMFFVSTTVSEEALAFFTIGAFAMHVVNLLRGAIADVIFPEIVELKHSVAKDALPLWKRATVWYCVMLFPAAIVFSYYADALVTVLFTSEYSAAIPVFAAFALSFYLYCFDFHLPLRVQNANRHFLAGSVIALIANLALLYPMYVLFGLVGPVLAFLASRLLFTVYLGYRAAQLYEVHARDLVNWPSIARILLASLLALPILLAGKYLVDHLLLRAVLFGTSYVAAYVILLRWFDIWDAFATFRRLIQAGRTRLA